MKAAADAKLQIDALNAKLAAAEEALAEGLRQQQQWSVTMQTADGSSSEPRKSVDTFEDAPTADVGDDHKSRPQKLRHDSTAGLALLTKEERLAKRKASLFEGDTIDDLAPREGPGKQTFRGNVNAGLSSRHVTDNSPAAEAAAKEKARNRPGAPMTRTPRKDPSESFDPNDPHAA